MTNELAIIPDMPVMELGSVLARSGYFNDAREAAQAVVKVLAGRELGFGPIASMTGFYIVKGHVSMSANLMGAAVKRSGKYDYKVTRLDNDGCSIAFYQGKEQLGESTLTMAEAKTAKMDQEWDKETKSWKPKFTWQNFPRNMLFARAMSNGVKWFCPDVTGGPVYTPEELGEIVDGETGEVVKSAPQRQTEQPAQPDPGPQWPASEPDQIKKDWSPAVVTWAVKTLGVKPQQAIGALKQSRAVTPDTDDSLLEHWLQIRKFERDNGVDGEEATARADADYLATRESANA